MRNKYKFVKIIDSDTHIFYHIFSLCRNFFLQKLQKTFYATDAITQRVNYRVLVKFPSFCEENSQFQMRIIYSVISEKKLT